MERKTDGETWKEQNKRVKRGLKTNKEKGEKREEGLRTIAPLFTYTRNSARYAHLFLGPAGGWGPFGPNLWPSATIHIYLWI